jgi:hypothetical protein
MVSPYLTPIRPSVINAGGKIQDWTLSGLAFHATGTNNTIWSPIVPPASGDGYWACPNANLIASGASTFTSTIVFADKDKATIESFALESVTIGGDAVENNGEKEACQKAATDKDAMILEMKATLDSVNAKMILMDAEIKTLKAAKP